MLLEVFGADLAPEVAARYLQEQASGRYRFRQQYARCGVWEDLIPSSYLLQDTCGKRHPLLPPTTVLLAARGRWRLCRRGIVCQPT